MPGLRDRFAAFRDRFVTDARFRAWAARFPLTRPLARRRARALFDLAAGFVYSQILAACVQLGLFDMLRAGPLPLAVLAPHLGLAPEAAQRLLDSAASLGLVARRGDGYGLGPLGAALVDNPAVTEMVRHHAILYADLADPVALLRRGEGSLARYWAYDAASAPADVADYSALMAASQPMIAEEVLGAYRLDRHRVLLDVGGGQGAFLTAAAARAPALRLMLFDLPAVAERARAHFAAVGLSGRAEVYGGSFHDQELPRGADVISLVRVIHDHDEAEALALLRRVHAALPPGGVLLLAEPLSGTAGAEPIGEAYFGMYLLAMGRGRPRTAAELGGLLRAAGFAGIRSIPTPTPMLTSVIVAQR